MGFVEDTIFGTSNANSSQKELNHSIVGNNSIKKTGVYCLKIRNSLN